jgi:hypothetical protein
MHIFNINPLHRLNATPAPLAVFRFPTTTAAAADAHGHDSSPQASHSRRPALVLMIVARIAIEKWRNPHSRQPVVGQH